MSCIPLQKAAKSVWPKNYHPTHPPIVLSFPNNHNPPSSTHLSRYHRQLTHPTHELQFAPSTNPSHATHSKGWGTVLKGDKNPK